MPRSVLGACLVQQNRLDEAEPLLEQSITVLTETHGEERWRTLAAVEFLASLQTARESGDRD